MAAPARRDRARDSRLITGNPPVQRTRREAGGRERFETFAVGAVADDQQPPLVTAQPGQRLQQIIESLLGHQTADEADR